MAASIYLSSYYTHTCIIRTRIIPTTIPNIHHWRGLTCKNVRVHSTYALSISDVLKSRDFQQKRKKKKKEREREREKGEKGRE